MDADLKEKWVTALRSGEYQQGRFYLKCDGAFCCLGVLNDIRGVEQLYDGLDDVLGCEWTYLARMNDEERLSFPKIADHIESNL